MQRYDNKKIWGFNPNVFFLGIVSLLTDISSEMIFTLVPLFLSNVLKSTFVVIGFVGGLSESIDAACRIFSGWFSDKVGKRKPLTVLGYSVSTIIKPFMYLATSWGAVLAVRFGDRVGKGIRSSSRDALIADSASSAERGKGFGLHRAMDTCGAVLGLVIAAIIIYLVQGGDLQLGQDTYKWIVLVGTVPAVIAVIVLIIFVRDKKRIDLAAGNHDIKLPLNKLTVGFDKRFILFLAVIAIFTLGNSSDFFVILRAQNLEAPLIQITMMLVLFNISYMLTSLPAGIISDRWGRKKVITVGWLIYTMVYLGFALSTELWQIWLLFAGYGVYYGMAEGAARAFVADLVPPERRGTAYGLYHGVIGITLFPASLLAGWLWQTISPAAPFYFGSSLAFLAMLCMLVLVRK
ncbi:MAG: MFS transporter [Dehalococcoidales bacterium]|nr:MFS transporter [Dehalococcoidales bacterium]